MWGGQERWAIPELIEATGIEIAATPLTKPPAIAHAFELLSPVGLEVGRDEEGSP